MEEPGHRCVDTPGDNRCHRSSAVPVPMTCSRFPQGDGSTVPPSDPCSRQGCAMKQFAGKSHDRSSSPPGAARETGGTRRRRGSTTLTVRFRPVIAVVAASLILPGLAIPAHAVVGPVGNGFTVTQADLAFILRQIKIAERHAATLTPANPCGTLVGPGPDQVPDALTSYGLRTVDGSCNNLLPGQVCGGRRAVPAVDHAGVQGRREPSCRLLRPRQPGRPTDVVRTEKGQRVRLAAAGDQQSDRRPDLDQPGRRGGRRLPGPGANRGSGGNRGPLHHRPRPPCRPAGRRRSRELHAVAQDPVHPQRDDRRRLVAAVQLAVHFFRTVLRPRCRPDRQKWWQGVRAAAGR